MRLNVSHLLFNIYFLQSWLLGFHLKYGVFGLVLGRLAGKTAQVLSYLFLVGRMNYENEVILARKRVNNIEKMIQKDVEENEETIPIKDTRSSTVS